MSSLFTDLEVARGSTRRLLRFAARIVLLSMMTLPAVAARAVIDVGEKAPAFKLTDLAGEVHTQDDAATTPLMLVFVKPDEKFTSETLHALDRMFLQTPDLGKGLRRMIVISRINPGDKLEHLRDVLKIHKSWPALLDNDDMAYKAYHIIATPTMVMVGKDQKVAATHPGYDPGMEQAVRLALAKMLDVKLPEAATSKPAPPNMNLQMGRHLAKRGLYERALTYYEKAAKEAPLPPQSLVDLADIYLNLNELDKAGLVIDTLAAMPSMAAEATKLRLRLEAIKSGQPDPGRTPRATLRTTSPTLDTRGQ